MSDKLDDEHRGLGNEVTPSGVVHKCSCGWVSRPCFSSLIASGLGADHREGERAVHSQGGGNG